jgi:hypothetical protein
MTTLEQMQAERLELLSHIDTLNQDKRYLRLQIDLNADHADIKAAYTEKLTRASLAATHAMQRLRVLNTEIRHENIERTKPKKAA